MNTTYTAAVANNTAQQSIQNLASFIVTTINNYLIPVLFALMLITFIWGVYQYFIAGGANAEKQKQGRQFVMWSIVGFVVVFSLWGIVNLVSSSLPLDNNQPAIPTLKTNLNSSNAAAAPGTSDAAPPAK